MLALCPIILIRGPLSVLSSPLVVKEDDEVDNLEIKLDKKKSKRVYQSPRPEVGQKISRSLKVGDFKLPLHILIFEIYLFYVV